MFWEYMQKITPPAHTMSPEEANKLGQHEWQMFAIDTTESAKIYWFKRQWKYGR
jgi:hypothetical protein